MGTAVAAILGCFSEILFLARFMGLLTQLIIRCSHCLSGDFYVVLTIYYFIMHKVQRALVNRKTVVAIKSLH